MFESPLEHHKMALALCCIAHASCTTLHKRCIELQEEKLGSAVEGRSSFY